MSRKPQIGLVWAESRGGVIGADGGMPWHLPEDLAHFKAVTSGHPVIMGRRTWESLPPAVRPLPGRTNIVVTRNQSWSEPGARVVHSLPEALAAAIDADICWVIGGAALFTEVIDDADLLEVTEIDADFAGDTFAPERGSRWHLVSADPESDWHTSRTGTKYRYLSYRALKS